MVRAKDAKWLTSESDDFNLFVHEFLVVLVAATSSNEFVIVALPFSTLVIT